MPSPVCESCPVDDIERPFYPDVHQWGFLDNGKPHWWYQISDVRIEGIPLQYTA